MGCGSFLRQCTSGALCLGPLLWPAAFMFAASTMAPNTLDLPNALTQLRGAGKHCLQWWRAAGVRPALYSMAGSMLVVDTMATRKSVQLSALILPLVSGRHCSQCPYAAGAQLLQHSMDFSIFVAVHTTARPSGLTHAKASG